MTHWTTRPICAFDLETTAETHSRHESSPGRWSRSAARGTGPGTGSSIRRRDPGRRGRRSRHLHRAGTRTRPGLCVGYREIRSALTDAWAAGHVVVAFNAAYDLTVLDAEGRRLGWPPLSGYGLVVDPTSSIGRWIVTGAASAHLAHCASTTGGAGGCARGRVGRPAAAELARILPGGSPTSRPSTTS